MVRTASSLYGFWLAGYYEDFIGSRCIADDDNAPSSSGTYTDTSTHHGNVMNGEATLNPRFRWSVRDRTTSGEFTNTTNYLLANDAVARWATFDSNRLGKGAKWVGRSQLQFPSSWAHPNRLRYNKATVNTSDDTYLVFSSGSDSSRRYYVPGGDTDATYGRVAMNAFNGHNWADADAGYISTGSAPHFMQSAHLTGVWTGERVNFAAYDSTTGNEDSAHVDNAERLFKQIRSKSGMPFLCIRTFMDAPDDHRLNNAAPSGEYRPAIHYDQNLNSRADGDVFTIRMAVHSHNAFPAASVTNGVNTGINTDSPPEYVLRVGFPSATVFDPNTGAGSATPAIKWTFRPDDGHGLSATTPYYHMTHDASLPQSDTEPWFDLDFVIDYTNNKFKVYHDGTEVTASNDSAGSYSSGYTLAGSPSADSMTGWDLTATNYKAASQTSYRRSLITTMIDRVALCRPLTDRVDNTNPSPVSSWSCSAPVNGISTADITILDDTDEQILTPFFTGESITDMWLLMFSGNIHRPLWRGLLEDMVVNQNASSQTREVRLTARDSLSLLDRQIAAWEIGQIGAGDSDVVLSRNSEVQRLADSMFMGAARLEQRQPTLGFEASDYVELQDQRPTRSSAHPIQIYNNEDNDGPNNVENEWLGYGIIGFNKTTTGAVEAIINGNLPTATVVGQTIEVYGSENYNGNYTLAIGDASDSTNSIGGIPTTYDLQELTGATWVGNTSATLQEISTAPTLTTTVGYNTSVVYMVFSARPTHGDGTFLKQGDTILITEDEANTESIPALGSGLFTIAGYDFDTNPTDGSGTGKFVVITDRLRGSGSTFTKTKTAGLNYSTEKGFLSPPTDESINYRNAHAVWMRDLPKSPWFRRHFGIIDSPTPPSCALQASCTAASTSIQVTSGFHTNVEFDGSNVAQIVDTDGFVDTFSYIASIASSDGNYYLVGVNGLSRDHSTSATVYGLNFKNDYKHTWVLWSDMRNNGDADAHGGERKKEFGLLQPVRENYDVTIAFSDNVNPDGSYEEFTGLSVGDDIDLWELDATTDPSTGAPWSKPLKLTQSTQFAEELLDNGGTAIREKTGSSAGKACFDVDERFITANSSLAVGDEVCIIGSGTYDGIHTIERIAASGTTRTITLETEHTSDVAFTAVADGPWVVLVEDDYRVSDLEAWESKGGSMLVVDASPFFNLNTFTNGGTFQQVAGGRTNLGDYDTEYHGFPILMDRYWSEATSSYRNNAKPYNFHPNYKLWNMEAAELNRTILVGDTQIETKASVSNIADFAPASIGRIKASRGKDSNNPSTEVFWYSWNGKLDTSVVESATSATSFATGNMVITCSGADFVNDGVEIGMRVRNVTEKWVADITAVTATTITVVGANIYQETGGTVKTVSSSDSISVPQQLFNVKIVPDAGRNFTPQEAEDYMTGYALIDHALNNGSLAEIKVNDSNNNATGGFDEVIVGASISPRFALRFLMNIDGFVETPGSNTYWMSDKVRFMWSLMHADTWLTQAAVPCWFDISTVPMSQSMTVDGTNGNADSFGSVYDARGGKSLLSIIREANETIGSGDAGSHNIATTYQMGRDNALEIRQAYNSGEALTRNSFMVSNMNSSMGGHVTNVRVYYNNGASFADFPEASLGSSYRWKIVEMPEVTSHIEATFIAKETYRKSKTKKVSVQGDIVRDADDENKMLGGRYGYVADVSREMERGAADEAMFTSGIAPDNNFNSVWSSPVAGNLFPGMVNALDGNLGEDGSDYYLRTRYGKGYYTQGSTDGATVTHDDHYWWWGANSISHAVQIVHVPTGTPLTSDTTGNDLRIWVALKDGQTGTDIDNAEFTVGVSDLSFDDNPGTPFTTRTGGTASFGPTKAATLATNGYQSVDVSKNGFYEVTIPTSYGAPASSKITISVNVDYLRDVLRHRCGDPAASGILHNAHDITEVGPSSWTATNADSLFPLGMRKYDNMGGGYKTRAAWYAPRIHVVEDVRFRPATQVTLTDASLGLSNEPMIIQNIEWSVTGRDIEQVSVRLERDQSRDAGGLLSYLFPNIARRRGNTSSSTGVGQGSGGQRPSGGGRSGSGGSSYGRPGGSSGPIGSSGYTPPPQQGGQAPNGRETGGFGQSVNSNAFTPGVISTLRGRMNTGDGGLSSSSFSILGQNLQIAPINVQRAVDGLDSAISPASGGATQTEEGWVFPGIVDSETSDRFTHTQSMNIRVPDDVSDEMVTITGVYSLGGTPSQTASVTFTLTCTETGTTSSITSNLSGNADRRERVFAMVSLNGMETSGNTLTVEAKRTPGSGDDDAEYAALVLHNVNVSFQRFSLKGFSTGSSFNPY